MIFDEEFPSLKGKERKIEVLSKVEMGAKIVKEDIDLRHKNHPPEELRRLKVFAEDTVQEHCLDKQKVREAWNKLLRKCRYTQEESTAMDEFEKELGL